MTTSSHYRRTTCILCDSARLELAVPLAPSAIGNDYLAQPQPQERYSLNLFLCHDCGNVQLEDVVNPALLFRAYTYATSQSLGLVDHFRSYAGELWRRVPARTGGLVIDIGSNDGSLLRAFQQHGMRVLGIDPAIELARRVTASGVPTIPDFFSATLARQIRAEHGHAAIITANNVFAHSDQLPDMADGIQHLLAPDGVFTFEVSYLVDIVCKMLFDTIYHEHLCYHSIRSLKSFFARHQLELIGVERIPTKGGSIRGKVQRAGGPQPAAPVIDALIEVELALGLDGIDAFRAYGARIDAARDHVRSLLAKLKERGQTIAGYGASPTVTTLIHQFGLADFLAFLVDDNPVKQHTFSPGDHLPVCPSEQLYAAKADYAVILAWNYAQPIMKRHQTFSDHGNRFVIPLPHLQVA
jgi:SAM-dependent methyltransferase